MPGLAWSSASPSGGLLELDLTRMTRRERRGASSVFSLIILSALSAAALSSLSCLSTPAMFVWISGPALPHNILHTDFTIYCSSYFSIRFINISYFITRHHLTREASFSKSRVFARQNLFHLHSGFEERGDTTLHHSHHIYRSTEN